MPAGAPSLPRYLPRFLVVLASRSRQVERPGNSTRQVGRPPGR
jgi:hypothetical protein